MARSPAPPRGLGALGEQPDRRDPRRTAQPEPLGVVSLVERPECRSSPRVVAGPGPPPVAVPLGERGDGRDPGVAGAPGSPRVAVPERKPLDGSDSGWTRKAREPQECGNRPERLDGSDSARAGQPGQPRTAQHRLQLGLLRVAAVRLGAVHPGTVGHLPHPDVRTGRLARLAEDHRLHGAAMRSGYGCRDRRGRRLHPRCARRGGRRRRDRGRDRPHGRGDEPGLRDQRGEPPRDAG